MRMVIHTIKSLAYMVVYVSVGVAVGWLLARREPEIKLREQPEPPEPAIMLLGVAQDGTAVYGEPYWTTFS
jgi:hypothetical protein